MIPEVNRRCVEFNPQIDTKDDQLVKNLAEAVIRDFSGDLAGRESLVRVYSLVPAVIQSITVKDFTKSTLPDEKIHDIAKRTLNYIQFDCDKREFHAILHGDTESKTNEIALHAFARPQQAPVVPWVAVALVACFILFKRNF